MLGLILSLILVGFNLFNLWVCFLRWKSDKEKLKQLLECSVKKLQFPKDIESILEEHRIKCIEDLLELSTKFLESINLKKISIKKIDDVLEDYDLYREMKYSQIDVPEKILAEINLNYAIKEGKR